jgi:hypothetical protein
MDNLTDTVKVNPITGRRYQPVIIAAMKLARKKMDRYYSLTDSSNTYRIAMVLHPALKLEYFYERKWKKAWIEQAKFLLRKEYHAKYEKETPTSVESTGSRKKPTPGFLSFGNLSVSTRAYVSELEQYLVSPLEKVVDDDALKWWTTKKDVYPNLHRMALDYLSIPGLSSYHFI